LFSKIEKQKLPLKQTKHLNKIFKV